MHKFPYKWYLKDTKFTKDKGSVFSCFAGGGGSSLGYKLAGFDVIGFNEIDPKMANTYIENLNPKYSFLEPIQEFKNRTDLPDELYNLDILDGSPPCSLFSMIGLRENGWGKEKKFREGQQTQILDTLAFDFIDLADKLQSKSVIIENVKGLLQGNAKKYLNKIHNELDKAGYISRHWLLNASKMGIPQRRERVFIIGIRKDLIQDEFLYPTFFETKLKLNLDFNELEIPFKEIESFDEQPLFDHPSPSCYDGWKTAEFGNRIYENKKFDTYKINPDKPLNTITSSCSKGRSGALHYKEFRLLTKSEILKASSFPIDYKANDYYYICGMSVPPIMIAQIATRLYEQILIKIK